MPPNLLRYADAPKTIPVSLDWDEINRSLVWLSPLDIDGVTIAGLQLRMTAKLHLPDESVMAQLEYHPPKGKPQQLVRAEWRPLSPHNNKNRGPEEWRMREFRRTHVHRFSDNWFEAEDRMRGNNLPIAIPIQDIDSYNKFLDICREELNIENMSIAPLPPWRPTML